MRALALCLVVAVSGCSFFVQGPRGDYSPAVHGPPECNRGFGGAGGVDILGGIFGSIVSALALAELRDKTSSNLSTEFLITGAAGTALHVSAIVSASVKVSRCKEADQRYKSWARQQLGHH